MLSLQYFSLALPPLPPLTWKQTREFAISNFENSIGGHAHVPDEKLAYNPFRKQKKYQHNNLKRLQRFLYFYFLLTLLQNYPK